MCDTKDVDDSNIVCDIALKYLLYVQSFILFYLPTTSYKFNLLVIGVGYFEGHIAP